MNSAVKQIWDSVPIIEKPYTKLLEDINNKKRCHNQSTFGEIEDFDPNLNICGTPMCTAGHLINMAGEAGYNLKKKYGFAGAALLIHTKSCPERPCQNFNNIPQDWALAYIETEAEYESKK